VIQLTAGTWLEAILHDREWDQVRDTPRVRSAFSEIIASFTHWPAPADFLGALSPAPRSTYKALGLFSPNAEPRSVSPAVQAVIDGLAQQLRITP
jgi:hypothetical protein